MQGRVDKEQYDLYNLYKEVEAEINVGLKVRIKDEDGNILHEGDGHCYTWQFMRMIIALMAQDTNITITSANASDEPNSSEPYIPQVQRPLSPNDRREWRGILGNNSNDNSWKMGILLETWSDTDDNALTKVTPYHMWKPYKSSYHSTGVINRDADGGPLEYKATQYGDITDDIANGVWKFTVSRQVINQSADDVVVKAMSLNTGTPQGHNYDDPFYLDYMATRRMIMRDIITSTDPSLRIVSANGGTLNFEYEIRIEGSNGDGTGYWTLLRGMIMRMWQQMTQSSNSEYNFNMNKMNWWENNHGEHGMVFSTDNNPIDPTNYRPSDMVSPIPDGEETGELKYYPTRVLIPDDGEPDGKGFVENVFKLKALDGDINSSAGTFDVIRTTALDGDINTDATYTDADIADFTTTDITTDDYVYDSTNDVYYEIIGITSSALNLASAPASDQIGVTVDILKSNVDFTTADVTESDLIYIRSTQTYYTIATGGIAAHTITLGETPPADLTGVTVDIIDNTDPRTEIVVSGVAENKSGGQIDAYKMYLNDDNEGNSSATIAGKHFSSSSFTFNAGDLGRCDLRIILVPDN